MAELICDFLSSSYPAYMIGHAGFLLFNIINSLYLIIFEFFTFRRINKLSCTCLFATLVQCCSCVTSVTRYNIGQPYSNWGLAGATFGILAQVGFFTVYSCLSFHWDAEKYSNYFFWGANVAAACVIYNTFSIWDGTSHGFSTFIIYGGLVNLFALISLVIGSRAHKAGKIQCDPSFISPESVANLFTACIFLEILALVGGATGLPIFSFPGTGLTFSILVVMTIVVPKMESVGDSGELRSLLDSTSSGPNTSTHSHNS